MRDHGNWMHQLDERILEALDEERLSKPSLLAITIPNASADRIHERCQVLVEAGYIEPSVDNWFELTTWGRGYLEGDVDADLIRPVPGFRPPEAVRPASWAGFEPVRG